MATGNLSNNLTKLKRELSSVKYPEIPSTYSTILNYSDVDELNSALIRIIKFAFLNYSAPVAQWIQDRKYDLQASTENSFLNSLYKLLLVEFKYSPKIRKDQFSSASTTRQAFFERKVLFCIDCIQIVKDLHHSIHWSNHPVKSAKKVETAVDSSTGGLVSAYLEDGENVENHYIDTNLILQNQSPSEESSALILDMRRRALSQFHHSLQLPLYPNRTFSDLSQPTDKFQDYQQDEILDKKQQQYEEEKEEECDIETDGMDELFVPISRMKEMTLDELVEVDDVTPEMQILEKAAFQIQKLTEKMQNVLERLDISENLLEKVSTIH